MTTPDLPDRIVVGENGAYWRDYGDHYSMAVVSEDNDPVVPVAVYNRQEADARAWDRGFAAGLAAQPEPIARTDLSVETPADTARPQAPLRSSPAHASPLATSHSRSADATSRRSLRGAPPRREGSLLGDVGQDGKVEPPASAALRVDDPPAGGARLAGVSDDLRAASGVHADTIYPSVETVKRFAQKLYDLGVVDRTVNDQNVMSVLQRAADRGKLPVLTVLRAALAQPEPLDAASKCDLVCGHSGDHWVAEEDDDA